MAEQQKALDSLLSSMDTKEFIRTMEKKDGQLIKSPSKRKLSKKLPSGTWGRRSKQSLVPSPPSFDVYKVNTNHMTTLTQFLLYNLDICTAIVEADISTPHQHEITQAILSLFTANRVQQQLITHCLKLEIQKNMDKSTLFRGSSAGSVLLSHYCKTKATRGLEDLLNPFFEQVNSVEQAIEIDPNRIEMEAALKNFSILKEIIEDLLARLYQYDQCFPSAVMSVFQDLHRNVILKYPETEAEIIGGFFFLRFFCPILLMPESVGIPCKVTPGAKRTVVLVSKVIQNISNRQDFKKEEHIPKMNDFLLRLANPPDGRSFFIQKADLDEDDILPSVSAESMLFLCKRIAVNGSEITGYLDDKSSANAFEGFYNTLVKSVHEDKDIGWIPLVPGPEERPRELGSVSREAFVVVRDALHLCEDELKDLRIKLEEERELRASMQHIIVNMSESIHHQIDERVKFQVEDIMRKLNQKPIQQHNPRATNSPRVRRPRNPRARRGNGNSTLAHPLCTLQSSPDLFSTKKLPIPPPKPSSPTKPLPTPPQTKDTIRPLPPVRPVRQ